jgi:hypothetical protein
MAHQVEHSSASEASDYLQVEGDASPAHRGEGPSEPSKWSSSISSPPPKMMMLVPVLMHFVSARMRTPYLSVVPVALFLSLTLIAQGAR